MTRAELKTNMETILGGTIISEKSIGNNIYFNRYLSSVKCIVNDVAEVQQVQYFVFDEGGAGEEAYYRLFVPVMAIDESLSTTAFREVVEAEIQSKVSDGTIEKGTIIELDEVNKKAVVSVYLLDVDTLYNRQYLIWENRLSNIQLKQIIQE